MPWLRSFDGDDENVAHVARHDVSASEAEEMLLSDPVIRRGPDGREGNDHEDTTEVPGLSERS